MGYLRPTAIVVSASYNSGDRMEGPPWIEVAHAKALEIFAVARTFLRQDGMAQLVSPIVEGVSNGERSFLIAWDGSKEGWDASDAADEARDEFVAWLRAQAYGDGSSPLNWAEIQYGGDDQEAFVLRHGDDLASATADATSVRRPESPRSPDSRQEPC